MVRMPAFGLDGPWRNNVGFAQTMEQMTGMAWWTGHEFDQPRIPRGPCDPLAGMHSAFAMLSRCGSGSRAGADRSSRSRWSKARSTPSQSRSSNTPRTAPCSVDWAIAVAMPHRRASTAAPATSSGSRSPWRPTSNGARSRASSATPRGRRTRPSTPTTGGGPRTTSWTSTSTTGRAHASLGPRPRSCSRPASPRRRCATRVKAITHPQLANRRYFEEIDHPVVGVHPVPNFPYQFASVDHWHDRAAPMLGEHNVEILRDLLGLEPSDIERLEVRRRYRYRARGSRVNEPSARRHRDSPLSASDC